MKRLSSVLIFLLICSPVWGATQLKKTVCPSGCDYTSLESAVNGNEQNLVTADKYFDVEISGTWSSADTTAVTVHNYTTDATRYINIYTTGDARHQGKKDTGYNLSPTNSQAIYVDDLYVTINGLEISRWNTQETPRSGIYGSDGGRYLTVKNCIFHTVSGEMTAAISHTYTCYVYNNIFQDLTASSGYVRAVNIYTGNIYNNTAINVLSKTTAYNGVFLKGLGATNCKNNICHITSNGACFSGAFTQSNNISSDATASGDGSLVNKTLDDLAFFSSTDLHLTSSSVAKDAGTDLGSPYNVDIDGTTRSGTWDIGADEYVATSSGVPMATSWLITGQRISGMSFN